MIRMQNEILESMRGTKDIFRFLEELEYSFDERSVGKRIKDYFEENGYSSGEVFRNSGLDRVILFVFIMAKNVKSK